MYCTHVIKLIYCLLHMMAWIRSQSVVNKTGIMDLFNNTTEYDEKRESSGLICTESGCLGPAAGGDESVKATSSVKARKGAHQSKISARKGVNSTVTSAPVYETSSDDLPIVAVASGLNTTDNASTNNKNLSMAVPVVKVTSLLNTTAGPASNLKMSTFPQSIPQKPKVTLVPLDADQFLQSLKSDRNVVIPVVALVMVPLFVLIALFIYKRITDTGGGTRYTQMGFLIEDIYND